MDSSTRLPAALPLVRDAGLSVGGVDPRWLALLGLILFIAFVVAARLRKHRAGLPRGPARRASNAWSAFGALSALRAHLGGHLGAGAVDQPLRVVQSARLNARASVHVLRWGEREWLIGCTDQQISVLADPQPRHPDGDASGSPAPETQR